MELPQECQRFIKAMEDLVKGLKDCPSLTQEARMSMAETWILEILHLADCPLRKGKDD